jgi:hypothetical protein
MTFSERMKDLLDQGLEASKDFASKAGEKAQDWGEKGYQASREFINKAGVKAQDLGERGVLMVEIRQLEGKAQKLLERLGSEVYTAFSERGAETVSASDAGIKPLLEELASIRESMEKREAELQSRKNNS